jgi:DNA-directed RNA polymerase subunit RPC12/RpoP
MYYVQDGTERCGLYECCRCHERFLDERIGPKLMCPSCGEAVMDMEIGPDDEMPQNEETAILQEVIEGAENVEKYDMLLSLAVTGGSYDWI